VADLGIGHESGYTRYCLEAKVGSLVVNRYIKEALVTLDSEMYPMVASRKFKVGFDPYHPFNLLYSDGSLMFFDEWNEWPCCVSFALL
jgi:hypothetical protein